MACSLDFIEFVSSQIATAGNVRYRKMFGGYIVYVDEKPVIIVCDNIPYVKEHEAIKSMMLSSERGFPYEGAKEHYVLDVSRSDFAVRVVKTLVEVLPYPKKRKKNK
ncbi:transcriptional regulator [Prevotella jejuni]|uniref:TfoX N-terminal domain-containing protein n=1 Tax=Prevotella jejuni TaxID=1177574 RepID=A0A2K9H9P5_9BACT|nr:TfoX/Sxy family protein [Prevotella jejuni]AUI54447.1 transcriptional regulator [Prevotella jejuni]SNR97292.1 TfoX N-terminal domain-containing protein [Prevotella jejuni]